MKLLSRFFKSQNTTLATGKEPVLIAAPAEGKIVPMEEIPDDVFARGMLGICCGIEPTEGRVYAPLDGTVVQMAKGGYSMSILGTNKVNIMIHAGIDTIMMKGDGFSPKIQVGDVIQAGQLLLEMDLERIACAGHSAMIITVISNSDEFQKVMLCDCDTIKPREELFRVFPR